MKWGEVLRGLAMVCIKIELKTKEKKINWSQAVGPSEYIERFDYRAKAWYVELKMQLQWEH